MLLRDVARPLMSDSPSPAGDETTAGSFSASASAVILTMRRRRGLRLRWPAAPSSEPDKNVEKFEIVVLISRSDVKIATMSAMASKRN